MSPAERPVRVLRVAEDNDEMLGYVGSLGLRPGALVTVAEHAPFGGPTHDRYRWCSHRNRA